MLIKGTAAFLVCITVLHRTLFRRYFNGLHCTVIGIETVLSLALSLWAVNDLFALPNA